MKTILTSLLLLLIGSASATAQTEKGRWTVGAKLGDFQYSTQRYYHSFSGSLTPSAGYFAARNLVVGAGIPLSLSTSKYATSNGDNTTSTSIGLSPFIRYYMGTTNLKPYAGLSYSYSKTHQRAKNPSQDIDINGFSSTAAPTIGLAYFINRNAALTIGLNYVWQWYDSGYISYDSNGNSIDFPTSTSKFASLSIGFDLFFGK